MLELSLKFRIIKDCLKFIIYTLQLKDQPFQADGNKQNNREVPGGHTLE